jgi:Aldehyde dehydrogenase family
MTFRQPFGVCAGIVPWNVAVGLAMMKIAPAIAAGNVIIIKTSEKAPLSPLVLGKIIKEVGFPPGVIQFINGYGQAGAALASHMDVRKLSFTGSIRTGKIVSEVSPSMNKLIIVGGKVKLEESYVGIGWEVTYHHLPGRRSRKSNSESCVWISFQFRASLYFDKQDLRPR